MDRYGPSRISSHPVTRRQTRSLDLRRMNSFTVASSDKLAVVAHADSRHRGRPLDAVGAIDEWAGAPLSGRPLVSSRSVAFDEAAPLAPADDDEYPPVASHSAAIQHAAVASPSFASHASPDSYPVEQRSIRSRPVDRSPTVVAAAARTAVRARGADGSDSVGGDGSGGTPAVSADVHLSAGHPAALSDGRHVESHPVGLAPSQSLPALVRSSMFASISRTARPRRLLRQQLRADATDAPVSSYSVRGPLPPLSPTRSLEMQASAAARFSQAALHHATAMPPVVASDARRHRGSTDERPNASDAGRRFAASPSRSETLGVQLTLTQARWRATSNA